jgi:hypothetical protein
VTGQHQFKLLKSKLTISTLDSLDKNKSRLSRPEIACHLKTIQDETVRFFLTHILGVSPNKPVDITNIAPTIVSFLKIMSPNACIGNPII